MSDTTARRGKIGSLPAEIREELNLRLFNGELSPAILPWVNGLPVVQKILAELWHGEPVSENNLSRWRQDGYAEWLKRRERVEHTKSLAEFSLALAKAGGASMSEGAAAIVAGKLLEIMETADEEKILEVAPLIADFRRGDLLVLNARQKQEMIAQTNKRIELETIKVQGMASKWVIEHFKDERVKRIAEGKDKPAIKMEKLRELMFGKPAAHLTGPVPV